jgi:hypothetical protein
MAYGSSHFFAGCDLAFSRSQPAPTFGDHGRSLRTALKVRQRKLQRAA